MLINWTEKKNSSEQIKSNRTKSCKRDPHTYWSIFQTLNIQINKQILDFVFFIYLFK